ncbi:hypothetical protein [Radicibacter daui]|uniref:hypothetical protein n=1 Tax=Radicibacter daui TaxID=3064829 RepID=UPI004046B8DE
MRLHHVIIPVAVVAWPALRRDMEAAGFDALARLSRLPGGGLRAGIGASHIDFVPHDTSADHPVELHVAMAEGFEEARRGLADGGRLPAVQQPVVRRFMGLLSRPEPWKTVRTPPLPGSSVSVRPLQEHDARRMKGRGSAGNAERTASIASATVTISDLAAGFLQLRRIFGAGLEVSGRRLEVRMEDGALAFLPEPVAPDAGLLLRIETSDTRLSGTHLLAGPVFIEIVPA